MANVSYCVLVVLYKMKAEEAPTLQSLKQSRDQLNGSHIVVWDNSPVAQAEESIKWLQSVFSSCEYFFTSENTGLSKIYNTVYRAYHSYSHFFILDQDSRFDGSYLQKLKQSIVDHPWIDLFVPLVRYKDTIVSPGRFLLFKGNYRKKVLFGPNSTKSMCVISSGMCISFRYLNFTFKGFDEELDFYGIDTSFSLQYRRNKSWFCVIAADFGHSLSINENESPEVKKRRFNNLLASTKILVKNENYLIKAATQLYLCYRNIKFKITSK
ncbi:glycosyltransferase family protein [Pseudocnuella soli]|uniref:glycosyltransferase n=1 Tax=Pseudocnuella soli TaxID=2502779 RepID=UPI001052306A|nr:glycosyltransferase [Pseudocnuella soli]